MDNVTDWPISNINEKQAILAYQHSVISLYDPEIRWFMALNCFWMIKLTGIYALNLLIWIQFHVVVYIADCWPRVYRYPSFCSSICIVVHVPAVSPQLWPLPKCCATFVLSLTVGCLAWSRGMHTYTQTHTNTHHVPMLLPKMGFHGEAGWENIRGDCLHVYVYVYVYVYICAYVCVLDGWSGR